MDSYFFQVFLYMVIATPTIISAGTLISNPSEKVWNKDVNYGNPIHWEGGKIPCSKNRIILPSTVSVFLQVNTSVREMVMPREGEIVFGQNTEIAFGFNKIFSGNDECEEKDIRFIKPEYSNWYSPDSWNVDAVENSTNIIPIPELERIPCHYDKIKFPPSSSFLVAIEGPPISIQSLSIEGEFVNSSEFERLLTTSSGELQFLKYTTVDIHNNTCMKTDGCVCGNDKPEINALVCDLITCPPIDCKDPIKPYGSCCALCGSRITIDYNSDFEFHKLHNVLQNFLKKPDYKSINGYLSKIKSGTVQVVFVDYAQYHNAAVLTEDVKNQLKSDMENLKTLGIVSFTSQSSQKWISHSLIGVNTGLSTGGVVGIAILFAILIAGGVVGFGFYRKHNWVNLSFGRLYEESKPEDDKVDSDISSFPETPATSRKGFANPMYQAPSKPTEPLYEDTAIGSQTKTVDERINPVYMGFEALEDME